MFHDLDTTLDNLLNDPGAPALLRAADVSFLSPANINQVQRPTVDLFLVSAEVNGDLRSREEIVDTSGPTYTARRPPMPVDCTYLVTVFTPSNLSPAQQVRSEHEILSLAAAWLDGFLVIPAAYLVGGLQSPFFLPEMHVALSSDKTRMGEFWSSLGIRPRTYFTLVVTIPLDLREPPFSGPVVTTFIQRYALVGSNTVEERIQIGGWLLDDPSGDPIPGAFVERISAGNAIERADADLSGRYSITGLRPGAHTLRAGAPARAPITRTITIPIDPPSSYVFRFS